jgi:ATP-dependent Clp endopeptidase proteolytic subunit ClpP
MIITANAPENIIEHPEDGPARFARPKYITVQEFDESTATRFTEGFNYLLNQHQSVIPIYISSPGGAIFSLMGIRDLIACSPKPVITFTASMAASCGALLLALGTKGYRYASPNAMILVHEASTASEGKTSEIINEALYIKKLNDELLELLAQNSNKSKDFYQKLIKKNNNADLFITPTQAKEWGIIDHIAVPNIEMNISVDYKVKPLYPNKIEKIKKVR